MLLYEPVVCHVLNNHNHPYLCCSYLKEGTVDLEKW